jgi:hypothetical protein
MSKVDLDTDGPEVNGIELEGTRTSRNDDNDLGRLGKKPVLKVLLSPTVA